MSAFEPYGDMEYTENTIESSPTKQINEAFAANLSWVDSIRETTDNSITQAFESGLDVVNISIETTEEDGTEYLIIEDDAGSVRRDNLEQFIKFGASGLGNQNGGISVYGVGLKSAAKKLGESYQVHIHHEDDEITSGILVPPEWFESTNWDEVREIEGDELESGSTRIVFMDLTSNFDESKLRHSLAKTYQLYLRPEGYNGLKVNLTVNGTPVAPAMPPSWSFTPFWVYPRRYNRIELTGKYLDGELDDSIYVTFTIGMVRGAGDVHAGTDIYCQGILVKSQLTGRSGGFSKNGPLGEFSPRKHRLRVIAEFETEGDKMNLPWNAAKNGIDTNGIWEEAMEWLSRFCEPYTKGYGELTAGHIVPFTPNHDGSYNNGEIVEYGPYDGYTQLRNGEKPYWNNIRKKAVTLLEDIIKPHARFRILCSEAFIEADLLPDDASESMQKAAYKEVVISYANSKESGYWVHEEPIEKTLTEDDFVTIDKLPEDITNVSDCTVVAEAVAANARSDARAGEKQEVDLWKQPIYNHEFDKYSANSDEDDAKSKPTTESTTPNAKPEIPIENPSSTESKTDSYDLNIPRLLESQFKDFEWNFVGIKQGDGETMCIPHNSNCITAIIETAAMEQLEELFDELEAELQPSEHSRQYPDSTISGGELGDSRIALDVKTGRKNECGSRLSSSMTLGSYAGYFRNPNEDCGFIRHPYDSYDEHWVLALLYEWDETANSESMVSEIEVIVEKKWKLASKADGSGTTNGIGSVTDLEDLRNGNSEFDTKEDFEYFWRNR